MTVGIIRRKPVLTYASIIFGGMLASVNWVKITNKFKNVLVTVGVVDGLALHGKLLRPRLGTSTAGRSSS